MTLTIARRAGVQQQVLHRPALPLPPTAPELWADCSNYTGALTDHGCSDLKAAGYVGVIVQAITGLDGRTYTRQQLTVAQRNGLKIAGYVWCFPSASASSMTSRLSMFDGFALESLYLDVEQAGLGVSDVDRDLAVCDDLQKTGVYSGRWYFAQQGWLGLTRWSDRPLWDSNYDGIPDASVNFRPYGGWTRCKIKQFQGTSTIGQVNNIDLNITAAD